MEKLINRYHIYTRKILIYSVILLVVNACQNKPNKAGKNNIKKITMGLGKNDINEIKQHIEYQKRIVSDENDSDNPYQPTERDLELQVKIIAEGLRNGGYKTISDQVFNQRLEELFGFSNLRQIKCEVHLTDNYISIFEKEDQKRYKELLQDEFGNSSLSPILFLMRKDHIITEMQTLSDLIHFKNDNSYTISLEPYIIHRNKYLFNQDASSLAWLINNQPFFLQKLLSDFGYDKEPKINKKILDLTYNDDHPELIAQLFFVKDCQNKLQIRKNLLKYVEDNTNAKDNRFIYALKYFIFTLYDGDSKDDSYKIFDEDPSKKFNAVEKAEIVANIANIENPAREKYKSPESSDVWTIPGSSLYNLSVSHPEVIKIIEQHHYFGLPKMKEIIAKLQEEAPPTGADPE